MNNNIDYKLLSLLSDLNYHTISQMSVLLDVNYKVIQKEISFLNKYFSSKHIDITIESKTGKGIRIVDDNKLLSELIKDEKNDIFKQETDSLNEAIIFELLNNEYTSVDSLCSTFSMSRTSVLNIIKSIKNDLDNHNISLASKPYYGYYIKAEELDIQKYLYNLLISLPIKDRCRLYKIEEKEYAQFSEKVLTTIKDVIIDVNDSEIDTILVWLQIINVRTSHSKYQEDHIAAHKTSAQYDLLADKLIAYLDNDLDADLNNEKQWIIAILESFDHENDYYDNSLQIKDDFLNLIINTIKEKYDMDFSHDLELYTSMRQHLCALLKRGRLGIFSKNPISDQVKAYFPLPYEMAVEIAMVIYKEYNILINHDEISFLAVYFHLAMERKKELVNKKNILVVCPTGNSMSQLMVYNIQKKFGDYISDIKACSISDLENINYNAIDYVFTSFPIKRKVPVPIVYLPLEIKDTEAESIRNYLNETNDGYSLIDLTGPDLFFNEIEAKNKESAIHLINNKIQEAISLPEEFETSVLERENLFTTEIDNYIAFPHPLKVMTNFTFMSITILKKPIVWNSKKVQIIMLGSIAEGQGEKMKKYYRQFSDLITNADYITNLISDPYYETLQAISLEIENKNKQKKI